MYSHIAVCCILEAVIQLSRAVITMDGFGSEDVVTPFSYGSVSEAMSDGGDKLETKVKRKFWKAKQKMVEKLGREQDHFIVQGDSEIDTHIDVRKYIAIVT